MGLCLQISRIRRIHRKEDLIQLSYENFTRILKQKIFYSFRNSCYPSFHPLSWRVFNLAMSDCTKGGLLNVVKMFNLGF